jgi:hypothetical protein
MINRLSAEYMEKIERIVMIRIATRIEALAKQATEGGRFYGQIKLPRPPRGEE